MNPLDNRKKELIDRAEVMSVLCSKTSVFWFKLKMIIQLPLIFTSSAMVILNSYFKKDHKKHMQLPNIIVNSLNVLLLTSMNMLKVVEKADHFKSKANEFLELSHQIEASRSIEQLDNEKFITLQDKYDMLIRACMVESIPEHIKRNVKKTFEGKKTVPLFINGMMGDNV